MATKKTTIKKLTVEQKLREEIEGLKDLNEQGGEAYTKLQKNHSALKDSVKVLFNFVHQIKANKDLHHDSAVEVKFGSYRDSMGERYEPTEKEMIDRMMVIMLNLAKDYAREDEGTALMQEHKDDLMLIIGALTHDDSRPNPKLVRLALTAHNIELAKANNHHLNVNHPDQYRDGRQGF